MLTEETLGDNIFRQYYRYGTFQYNTLDALHFNIDIQLPNAVSVGNDFMLYYLYAENSGNLKSKLETVNFTLNAPNLETVGNHFLHYSFANTFNNKVTSNIILPKLETAGSDCFTGMVVRSRTNSVTLNLPSLSVAGNSFINNIMSHEGWQSGQASKPTGENYSLTVNMPNSTSVGEYLIAHIFRNVDAENVVLDVKVGAVGRGFLTAEYTGGFFHDAIVENLDFDLVASASSY